LEPISQILDAVYRTESRRVFATLVRILGDFDLAGEALHEAFASALEQWPRDGVPENPRAWLVSTGRFRGVNVFGTSNRCSTWSTSSSTRATPHRRETR